ncbi:zinc-finger homeodomain protein 5 [Rhodamnia argentea]|uniref:Zinc-finger homeodomain protein 5 n=1 Tax=Rhodamnia argentea TaxID=178133 RepID=A0ABM3GZG5_9MYRT|nr:zinc-finger homeodomain protein 5 [Rhodamnia argentea]XP_048129752.1 zinc-finger homeodomain protein 5 [Rhodamnia argentea]XP_048129753.1 zinc-finger homeodomain protein 5 [Rhodamnia argentea]
MELKPQEDDVTAPVSSLGFAHFARDSRRIEGLHNGAPILGASPQTLDHPLQQRPNLHRHLDDEVKPEREDSNPDPVSFAFSRSPALPAPAGSKPKPAPSPAVRYRECLRNHAASVGGSVYDGCGEFMPAGEDGTAGSLRCAACECHRNFHRKEVDGEALQVSASFRRALVPPLQLPPPPLASPYQRYSVGVVQSPMVTPMSVAFGCGGGGGNESSSEDLNLFGSDHPRRQAATAPPFSKKRHRTKFTPEQKERMMEFAEKVGWRIQKQNEEEVERFCGEIGVRRQVLKVWMHNNKNNGKNKQASEEPA